ncbi:hypothetical protein [Saccharopolyspora sp. NPDC002376]
MVLLAGELQLVGNLDRRFDRAAIVVAEHEQHLGAQHRLGVQQ